MTTKAGDPELKLSIDRIARRRKELGISKVEIPAIGDVLGLITRTSTEQAKAGKQELKRRCDYLRSLRKDAPFGQLHVELLKCVHSKNLSRELLDTFLFLLAHRHSLSGKSSPGYKNIAEHLGVSDKTIGRYISELESLGLLFREEQGRRGRATTFFIPENEVQIGFILAWNREAKGSE